MLFRNIRSTLKLVPEQLVVQRSSTKTHKRNRIQTRCFQHHFPIRLEVCTASRSTGWHPLIDFRATRCEKRGAEGSSRLTADWPKAPVWRQDTCCSAATATTSQGGVLARRLSRHPVRNFSLFLLFGLDERTAEPSRREVLVCARERSAPATVSGGYSEFLSRVGLAAQPAG